MKKQSYSLELVILLFGLAATISVNGFVFSATKSWMGVKGSFYNLQSPTQQIRHVDFPRVSLSSSTNSQGSKISLESQLSSQEQSLIDEIWTEATKGQENETLGLAAMVESKLSTIPAGLIVTLRQFVASTSPEDVGGNEMASRARAVGLALSTVLDAKLEISRDVLQSFMQAGEIRKLDSLIGKAAREGKLDSSFFTVLSMNLKDAYEKESKEQEEGEANRMSILQHIYTRCQEEMEKQAPPGVGLLHKLMRTEQAAIRRNQLEHYLGLPEQKTISTPDGKTLQLQSGGKALVPPNELASAIQDSVKQVRSLERSGATSREAAAYVVEQTRNIAKEARIVVGELYGVESQELIGFEDSLMPVFRPSPGDSEYMPSKLPTMQVVDNVKESSN